MRTTLHTQTRPPQCQHREEGRCAMCAYPTMWVTSRYIEQASTEKGKAAAFAQHVAERRPVDKGGRRNRKMLRAERMGQLFVDHPRAVSALSFSLR